jgi:hypothetical protein
MTTQMIPNSVTDDLFTWLHCEYLDEYFCFVRFFRLAGSCGTSRTIFSENFKIKTTLKHPQNHVLKSQHKLNVNRPAARITQCAGAAPVPEAATCPAGG